MYGHYTKDTNILFYIGVGTILNLNTERMISRYSRAYHTDNRNNYWNNVYNKHGFTVEILSHFNTKEESLVEENRLISLYGKRINDDILCNISDGGDIGPIGIKRNMSEEQKLLLSDIKSITLYVYNKDGIFIKFIKTIEETAKFCGVTYNAVHSCLSTKNFTNNYFVFKEYKGNSLDISYKDLNFKSTLSKRLISINVITNIEIIHESIADCATYLKTDRKNLKKAISETRLCKGHIITFEGQSAAKPLSSDEYEEGSTTISKESTFKWMEIAGINIIDEDIV